jgi:hypothetical protein
MLQLLKVTLIFVAAVALCAALALALNWGFFVFARRIVHADEQKEIAPYKFADLPHGRIYKAVHEGCELYIVESEWTTGAGLNETYQVATGRGCK